MIERESSYGMALAQAYDTLNDGIDHVAVADYILKLVRLYSDIPVADIGETACGTGNMACELSRRGYRVTASDISEDMLTVADKKARDAGLSVRFVLQDMRFAVLYSKKDLMLCLLDSMNYLLKKQDVLSALKSAYDCLKDGGLFIFDMNSRYKFETIYAQNDYVLDDDGVYCGWQNDYNENTRLCRFYLSIFCEKSDGDYTRVSEYQCERMYTVRQMESYAKEVGFTLCAVYGDRTFEWGDESRDERLYYVLKKEAHHE